MEMGRAMASHPPAAANIFLASPWGRRVHTVERGEAVWSRESTSVIPVLSFVVFGSTRALETQTQLRSRCFTMEQLYVKADLQLNHLVELQL